MVAGTVRAPVARRSMLTTSHNPLPCFRLGSPTGRRGLLTLPPGPSKGAGAPAWAGERVGDSASG